MVGVGGWIIPRVGLSRLFAFSRCLKRLWWRHGGQAKSSVPRRMRLRPSRMGHGCISRGGMAGGEGVGHAREEGREESVGVCTCRADVLVANPARPYPSAEHSASFWG